MNILIRMFNNKKELGYTSFGCPRGGIKPGSSAAESWLPNINTFVFNLHAIMRVIGRAAPPPTFIFPMLHSANENRILFAMSNHSVSCPCTLTYLSVLESECCSLWMLKWWWSRWSFVLHPFVQKLRIHRTNQILAFWVLYCGELWFAHTLVEGFTFKPFFIPIFAVLN